MIEITNMKYMEKVEYPWVSIGYRFEKQPDGSFSVKYFRAKQYPDGRTEDVTGNPDLN